MMAEDQQLEVKKQAIEQCVKKYVIPRNLEIDDSVIALDCFPKSSSKKLAFLILAYKREVPIEELRKISDQPAGLIRDLREDGFVFKSDGKNNANFLFKNAQGSMATIFDQYKANRKCVEALPGG
jgi:hypothetical protein